MALNPKLDQYKRLIATYAPNALPENEELIPPMEDEQEKIDSNLGAISPSMDKLQTQQEATTPVRDDIPGMDKRTEEEMTAADEIAQEAVDLENKVKPEIQQPEETIVPRDAFGGTTQMSQDYMNMPETDKAGGRTLLSQAYLDMPEDYRSNIQDQELSLDNEIQPPQMSRLDMYRNLLSQAQKDRRAGLLTSNMLLAGNQIAQGFARSRGGQIGTGEEAVRALREQAQLPVSELGEEMKTSTEALDLSLRESMRDPESNISKYKALLAKNVLKRMNPDLDPKELEQIGKMSADEIDKLGLGVGALWGGRGSGFASTSFMTPDKIPLVKNNLTGQLHRSDTMEAYNPSEGLESIYAKIIEDQYGRKTTFDPFKGSRVIKPAGTQDTLALPESKDKKQELPVEVQDNQYIERLQLDRPDKYKMFKDNVEKIDSSEDVKKLKQAVDEIETSKSLLKQNSPGSGPMLSRALLSVYESGGRFTDQDVEQMQGPTDVKAKFNRFLVKNFDPNQAVSEIDKNAQMMILKLLEKKKTEQFYKKFKTPIERLKTEGINPDFATRYFTGGKLKNYNDLTNISSSKKKTKLHKVKTPNGEVKLIPDNMLKKALEAGGKLVEE